MFNALIRAKFRLIIAFAALVIALTLGLPARPAFAYPLTALSNLQFHIGCSGFTASADTTNGFGMEVFGNAFTSTYFTTANGHITVNHSYGRTFPQGTVFNYLIGDYSAPNATQGSVACSDSGYQGPGIPAGFVLLTITCNTPVYTNPGGSPSGSNAITAGQTWYVNPVSVKDAKGNSWTEVFVSSYNDPFIPTSCLGGAPAK